MLRGPRQSAKIWYNSRMNISLILAAVALVPQPAKLVETGGVTKNAEIRYVTDSAVPAEGYRLKVAADGVTVTSSGLFSMRRGKEELPRPRLTHMTVFPSRYIPAVYLGRGPWPGA